MQNNALSTSSAQDVALGVCGRFKTELEMNMTDPEAASICEVSLRTIQNWKKKVPIPSDKLAMLSGTGVDLVYILTAERHSRTANSLDDWKGNDIDRAVPFVLQALNVCESHGIRITETNVKAVVKSILKNADRDESTQNAIFETLASVLD